MADAKLSELAAVSTAVAADLLYLSHSGASKKITVANLFATVDTPVSFGDKIAITDTNTVTTPSAITIATNITYLNNFSANGACTLNDGTTGQLKIIIMIGNSGSRTVTLDGANISNAITFNSVGDSATLIYTNSKWYFIGGSATVA